MLSSCRTWEGQDSLAGASPPSEQVWAQHRRWGPLKVPIKWPKTRSSSLSDRAAFPIILSIWRVSVDRHEITSRAFFDNCQYFHKDGQPYWRQSQVLCVCWGEGGVKGRGGSSGWWGGLQCQTDASESRSRGRLIFIDMSKLILIRIWIAMDCVKQRYNREVLKERLRSKSHFIRFFFFFFFSLLACLI